ncbi:MAG: hypothetical protein ACLUDM_11360 [[Eubacterium] siraeum]
MRVKAGTSSSLCSKAKRKVDISKRVYQRLRLIGYGTVPDFFCCSAEYRQQINRPPTLAPHQHPCLPCQR